MAYAASGLHKMAGASGVQLFIYQTADAIAAVNSAGYFNSAAGMLNIRDLIIVMDTDTPTTSFVSVLSNTGSVVDVSDGTAVAETDSD